MRDGVSVELAHAALTAIPAAALAAVVAVVQEDRTRAIVAWLREQAVYMTLSEAFLRTDTDWYAEGLARWPQDRRNAYVCGFIEAADALEAHFNPEANPDDT
jgi:uncharacterized membrane protein